MDPGRPTTVKTRIIAGHQQVVRVDLEKKKAVSEEIRRKLADIVLGEKCRGIVLSDYDKGLLTAELVGPILAEAEARKVMVFVDPKVANFGLFSPVTLITPNHAEAERIVHHECRTDAQVEKAGREILARVRSRFLILKRGEQGLSVFEAGKPAVHIPTVAREVFDVTGAGDTVISVLTAALAGGASLADAARLANYAGGIVVMKKGTAVLSPLELKQAVLSEP
jgi:D-beta-D-heptose 7-phosphate kinase/D-beta-D-heptose 1-phosphate adenosyltransferase